jgi:hypothetical protein
MLTDSTCDSRCTGKDGDPSPMLCFNTFDPEEIGVCRQVCEQGQHDVGPGSCPSNFAVDLRCCLNEYEGPGGDACPPEHCPGPSCPPWCATF